MKDYHYGTNIINTHRHSVSYLAVTASQIQHHLGSTLSSKVLHTLKVNRLPLQVFFYCKPEGP